MIPCLYTQAFVGTVDNQIYYGWKKHDVIIDNELIKLTTGLSTI